MATARTHCPECHSRAVIDLAEALVHREVDFFWCGRCRSMWHLRKDEDWPPSKALLEPPDSDPRRNLSLYEATARQSRAHQERKIRSHPSTRASASSHR
jgi:hypothetical protein